VAFTGAFLFSSSAQAAPVGFCDHRGASAIAPLPVTVAGPEAIGSPEQDAACTSWFALTTAAADRCGTGKEKPWAFSGDADVMVPYASSFLAEHVATLRWGPCRLFTEAPGCLLSIDRPPRSGC